MYNKVCDSILNVCMYQLSKSLLWEILLYSLSLSLSLSVRLRQKMFVKCGFQKSEDYLKLSLHS